MLRADGHSAHHRLQEGLEDLVLRPALVVPVDQDNYQASRKSWVVEVAKGQLT